MIVTMIAVMILVTILGGDLLPRDMGPGFSTRKRRLKVY
jgi:hypothetical protein